MKLEKGFGLIEVLVAVLLIGTSLLAMSSLQVRSLKQNNEALMRTEANLLAYDILERVRMASPMAPNALVQPSAESLKKLASAVLPEGDAVLQCDGSRMCTIDITWTESSRTNDKKETASKFTYATRL
ncbi:MAG: type IV pilus modification protein PilV [Cellvibrio sp. 79]|nr:MAG: type IV pilus modification protein PilV [Cellvibrio sp. 79]